MKSKSPPRYHSYSLFILILGMIALALVFPVGKGFADSNSPTVTPTWEPTATESSSGGQTEVDPSPTSVPIIATTAPENPFFATPVPPPTSITGGLSLLNRILLVLLAIITVVVMGVIVYAIYYRTQIEGLDDR